jgi:hypothetical protein
MLIFASDNSLNYLFMEAMTYTESNIVEAYSFLFGNLSNICKAELADRLSKSLAEEKEASKKKYKKGDGFTLSFGKWEHPEQNTEEIKAEIKANRKFRKKTPIFG